MEDRALTEQRNPLLGDWRIEGTELWGAEGLDLLGPAVLSFSEDGLGSLRLGALEADVDHRICEGRKGWRADFSWTGFDDGSPVSGRGWVHLVGVDEIQGKLFIHLGDEARFRARRK